MNSKTDKRYETLLDLSSDGIHVLDEKGNVIDYNKAFAKMLGYSDKQMQNLNVRDFDAYFDKDTIADKLKNLVDCVDESEQTFETKHLRKDGKIIDVLINVKCVEINNKKFIYATSKDISKEKTYKKELELEKSKLQTIIRNLPDLLWIKDPCGKFITCNKRFEDLYGAKVEDIVGKTDYDFVDKELAEFFAKHDREAMYSDIPLSNFEELTFASDGHKEFLNTTKVRIEDDDNNILGVLGLGIDLTKIKKYQEELEKEKSKYKILMESSSEAIFIIDLEANILDCSNIFKTILGYGDEEISKLHVWDIESVHSKEQILENIKQLGFTPIYFESKYRRKDGSLFDASVNIVKVLVDNKELVYSAFRDITEDNFLKESVLKQKEEFETIFNYSHDSIAIIDLEANFLHFNQAFMDMLEYSKEELLSKNCKDVTAPEDFIKSRKIIRSAIKKGHADNLEKCFITKTGKKVIVNISASLLPDKKRVLFNMKDISILKMMEEQSKLASMGEMIGNIAHQWRQPLSVITTNISGLKLKSDLFGIEKSDLDVCEENILKQAKYLSDTIDNFRNFIKGDKVEEEISLRTIIENALSLVNSSMHNNFITEVIDLKDDLKIFANKNELAEAFINILNNSKDALKTNIKNESDRVLFITTKLIDKQSIKVEILDSGLGIEEGIMNKIFEPYFTTKYQSQGTGLGLSMADKIIRERHGALLEVSNKEFEYNGKKYFGASFEITFSQK